MIADRPISDLIRDNADLRAELELLRGENRALKVAMGAIRQLTDLTGTLTTAAAAINDAADAVAATPATSRTNLYDALQEPQYWPYASRSANSQPYWAPPVPEITDLVIYGGFTHRRVFDGETIRLDRNGAGPSAASSVVVAHDALQATRTTWEGLPGFYRVEWFPWEETDTPHPFGGYAEQARRVGHAWLPHTRVRLLDDLFTEGRWPGLGTMDAYIGQRVARLDRWAALVKTRRNEAVAEFGRDSEQFRSVKDDFSITVSRLCGSKQAGQRRTFDGPIRRPDWGMTIQDLKNVTVWRWYDQLGDVAARCGRPDLRPVAIQNMDEIVIPAEALEMYTTQRRRRGGPLVIDQDGTSFGTFKVVA